MTQYVKYGKDEAGNRVGMTEDGRIEIVQEPQSYVKTGTDEAGNRVGMTADGKVEVIIPPAQTEQPKPAVLPDIAKSAAIGIPKGVAGLVGFPSDVMGAIGQGVVKLANKAGLIKDENLPEYLAAMRPEVDIGSRNIQRAAEKVTGNWYEPKTAPGRVAQFTTSLLPAMGKPSLDKFGRAVTVGIPTGTVREGLDMVGVKSPYAKVGIELATALLANKGYDVGKSFVEPLSASGREAIAGRYMNRVAGDEVQRNTAVQNMRNAKEYVPGSQPTVGQASNNAGLATAERTIFSAAPNVAGDVKSIQNAARVKALDWAGDQAAVDAAKRARNVATKPKYDAVTYPTPIPDKNLVNTKRVINLIDRMIEKNPANKKLVDALNSAREGLSPSKGISYRTSPQHVKSALDNVKALIADKDNNFVVSELTTVKNVLSHELGKAAPSFKLAEKQFAEMSKPINQMQVGQEFIKRGSASQVDSFGNPILLPGKFGNAMKSGDAVAKHATGFKRARLDRNLTAEQIKSLENVNADLARAYNAENLGKMGGSDTYQKSFFSGGAAQSGIPIQAFSSPRLNPITNWLAQYANRNLGVDMNVALAKIMADPKYAASVMEHARKAGVPVMPANVLMQNMRENEGGLLSR